MEALLSKAVLKATDPKLRVDNWQYIIGVCDLVKQDPEDNGKEVIRLIQLRLTQNDANVILRSLSLIIALAENCGSRLKQEIDSKSFTRILNDLIDSELIHINLKKQIALTVKQLYKSFKDDPSLKSMKDLYKKVKLNYPYLLQNEGVHGSTPPAKPSKNNSNSDVHDDDAQLQQALKLSLQEYEQSKQHVQVEQQQQQQQQVPQAHPEAPAIPTIPVAPKYKRVQAMYDLISNEQNELSFKKGDIITVIDQVYKDWWKGSLNGKIGIFPINYVSEIKEKTEYELNNERQIESKIFKEKLNVDQLHHQLKDNQNSLTTNDPEFNRMYSQVTPLRPQITKLIGKYNQEKNDLINLNQILSNAELTYNKLINNAANSYYYNSNNQQQQLQLQPQPQPQQQQQQQQQYMPPSIPQQLQTPQAPQYYNRDTQSYQP